ncbi:MAG: hypothetical protein AB8C46_24415 [Burkholderiaceae bacterium]
MAVENVLAGNAAANRARERLATPGKRTALVAGVVGRLGETLLNGLLARGGYTEVIALAERPVNLGISKLSVAGLDQLPPIDDLFILLGGDDFSTSRSFHGRDAPFVSVHEHNALGIARAANASRITLVSASSAWQQFGPLNQGLTSPLERELAALECRRFVVLRPVRENKQAGLGFVQRFVNVYLSIQMLMMPRSVPTLTSEQVARATVLVLADHDVQGVSVLGAADLADVLSGSAASAASNAAG